MVANLQALESRSLFEGDIAAIAEIESDVYEEPWSEDLLLQSLRAPMTHTRAFFDGDRCLAYAIYQVILAEGHLLNLAVARESQGQGLGKRLLDEILNLSRDEGVVSFFLEVRPSNVLARKLYEQRGFKLLFTRSRYYSNGEDALVLTKDLLEGD